MWRHLNAPSLWHVYACDVQIQQNQISRWMAKRTQSTRRGSACGMVMCSRSWVAHKTSPTGKEVSGLIHSDDAQIGRSSATKRGAWRQILRSCRNCSGGRRDRVCRWKEAAFALCGARADEASSANFGKLERPRYVLCRQSEGSWACLPADLHRHLRQSCLRQALRSQDANYGS